jgi:peptide/nickel transport system permease protein
MGPLVARRLAALVAVLIGLVFIVFLLQTEVRSDPARAMVGVNASKAAVDAKRKQLGLDKPLPTRFADFMGRLAHGDLQSSLRTRNPVSTDLGSFAPATIELAAGAALLAALLGGGLGLLLAGGGRGARAVKVCLMGGASVPPFLTGLALILLFYTGLHLLPASGWVDDQLVVPRGPTGMPVVDGLLHGNFAVFGSALSHLLLPALTLALLPALAIARTLGTSLSGVLGEDYVRTARAKGLRERTVILRHGLRNAVGPTLTMAGLQLGLLLGGVVVVERIFSWPGLGLYIDQSIQYSDYPAIIGTTLVLGATYIVLNFLVDVAQAWADPRIRTI